MNSVLLHKRTKKKKKGGGYIVERDIKSRGCGKYLVRTPADGESKRVMWIGN